MIDVITLNDLLAYAIIYDALVNTVILVIFLCVCYAAITREK